MKKVYFFLTILTTLLGCAFTNTHAQEPAVLSNYRITKIGAATNTVVPDQWYLVGRNKYMLEHSADALSRNPGYLYDDSYETYDETSRVANAACTEGNDNAAVPNWTLTQTGTTNGVLHVNKHSANPGIGAQPFSEYWVYNKAAVLSDATISHDQVTGLTPGVYEISVTACMYSEYEEGTQTSANPVGISFYGQGTSKKSVALNTGTPSADGRGFYGTYSIMVEVGVAGTLDIGFDINGATCNWLAFKNVTLARLGAPFAAVAVSNGEPNSGSAGTAGSSRTIYQLTSTLTDGGEYLVVSRNSAGAGYALGHSGATKSVDAVTIKNNAIDGFYIEGDVEATSIWTVGGTDSYTFTNGGYYLRYYNRNLTINNTNYTNWRWSSDNNRLSYRTGGQSYYIRYNSTTFDLSTTANSVYLFRKVTIDIPATPGSLDNWSTTDYNLSLQTTARYNLGDTWTGNAGDLYNDGSVFANATTVSHDQLTGLANGKYQISVDARMEGTDAATSNGHVITTGPFYYGYQSTTGSFYEGRKLSVDTEAILTSIGATNISEVTVYAENPNGTRSADILNGGIGADGWRTAEGAFTNWGNNSAFYVKFNPTLDSEQVYELGGMDGQTGSPAFYKAKYVYVNNSTSAEAVVYITLGYYHAKYDYNVQSTVGRYYENLTCSVDNEAILASLGAPNISDVTVYGLDADGVRYTDLLGNTKYAGCDGYRDGNGSYSHWNDRAPFYVKLNPTLGANQAYQIGGHQDRGDFPASYTARYVYVYNGQQVAVNIILNYVSEHVRFFAGGSTVNLNTGTMSTGSDDGYRGTYTLETNVTDGTLDFGFHIPAGSCKWLSFKNVTLYYLGMQGVKMSNDMPNALESLDNTHPVLATDVKRYLVRFVQTGWSGSKYKNIYNIQMGTGKYLAEPEGNGKAVEASASPGSYFAYTAEGYRPNEGGTWTVGDGIFIKATNPTGSSYNYYIYDRGVTNPIESAVSGANDEWAVDVNENAVFTLYPLDVCEIAPDDKPSLTLNYTGKFYKIKNKATGKYASYSTYTSSLYPELLMEKTAGYATITRDADKLTGSSYWWFSDATTADIANSYQYFAGKGTKRVRIHNVMMHDMDYTSPTHTNETMYSTMLGVTSGGRLYYLLPAAQETGHDYWALSRSEYSGSKDSWFANEWSIPLISQAGALNEEKRYNESDFSQWELEEAPLSEVWAAVKASKRNELHEGAYFSPTTATLDAIFGKSEYTTSPSTQAELFTKIQDLGREIYAACTDASLPILAPEEGGRFYFKSYAAPTYYFAENNGLTMENGRDAKCIWEIVPYSDPTPIVRVDDQPLYNDFCSAYYETLLHRPLQRFWLRNRATGKFLTHAPFDKSGYTKIGEGVWNMNTGGVASFANWIGNSTDLGTMGSLEREGADLWYFDVVSNPRTGLRTGVLRTLFCYDYGPWIGTSWDGTFDERGMPTGQVYGDAIAGYNYPVVKLSPSDASVIGGGVTVTDNTRAYSQWVIYDIDTDLPEVGVNYTLKNKLSGMYAYWAGTTDSGSLNEVETVESLSDIAGSDPNRGVWRLTDLATPEERKHLTNVWALADGQTKKNLTIPSTMGSTGSSLYFSTSNADEKGIAIGTAVASDSETGNKFLVRQTNESSFTTGPSKPAQKPDRAVWSIDKVDRLMDDVTYELDKKITNIEGKDEIFYIQPAKVESEWTDYVSNWIGGNITANNEYPTYVAIKDLIEGKIGDDCFKMPEGDDTRYLIKNKETGRYLTNLGQLVDVDAADLSYYSIWRFGKETTESGKKYLYTLTNEGANFVMGAENGTHETGTPYIAYDASGENNCFVMSGTGNTIHFRPDGAGYARFHSSTESNIDKVAYGPSLGDHLLQSRDVNVSNAYWTVVPVSSVVTSEATLVQNTMRALAGYSGGPLTLEASEVTGAGNSLTTLKTNIDGVTAGTASAGKLGELTTTMWNPTKGANPREKYLLTWKAGFPLYIENIFRPAKGARLIAGGGDPAWTTTTETNDALDTQTFEFEDVSSNFRLKNNGGNYLSSSTGDGAAVGATTETASAAQLTVKEVVPGMYSMMDGNNRFLSISEDGDVVWAKACGYGALWRIKCNDYERPVIQKVSGASEIWQGDFVNTYVSDYDTQMKATDTDNVKVYYALNAASAGDNGYTIGESTMEGSTVKQLKIKFKEVTAEGGYYLLQGGQPYLIVKNPSAVAAKDMSSATRAQAANDEIKVWSKHNGTYESGTLVGKNLMKTLDEAVTITAANQRQYFELNYIAPGTEIGSIGGQKVYAFGIGFYPLKTGRTIPAGKPIITSEMLGNWVSKLRESISNVKGEVDVHSLQIILEDEDGTSTDLSDILMDNGQWTMEDGPIYDLNGRKIAERWGDVSRRGVYIVNGQKVLRK